MSKTPPGKVFDPLDAAQEPETTVATKTVTPDAEVKPQLEPPTVLKTDHSTKVGDPRTYRVIEDGTASFAGHHTTLHAGDEVSDRLYGPGTVARLRESRIKLEQISKE